MHLSAIVLMHATLLVSSANFVKAELNVVRQRILRPRGVVCKLMASTDTGLVAVRGAQVVVKRSRSERKQGIRIRTS